MKKLHKKHYKRFLLLNIAVVLAAIAGFLYVAIVGDSYVLHTHNYIPQQYFTDFTAEYENEGVVEMTGAELTDKGEIVFHVRSVGSGRTNVTFVSKDVSPDAIHTSITVTFHVNALGTVFHYGRGDFSFSGYDVVIILILGVMALTVGVMVFSFLDCRRRAKFSYAMIACGGVALYFSVLILFVVYKMLNNMVVTFSDFLRYVLDTGVQFLALLSPLMLALAVAISVSNIRLMRREGYRPVNALGIAFSVLWLIGMVISLDLFVPYLSYLHTPFTEYIRQPCIFLACYLESMLLSTIVCAVMAVRHQPPYDRDYIIILGCAIRSDGSLTPLLRMRADSAIAFERRQAEQSGKHTVFVPSGGQGSDEVIPEGEAMRRYLLGQGIPEEQIVPECRSVNTMENMKLSKEVIDAHYQGAEEPKIAFATTNYHVFRGYILSRKNGFDAQGISAKTKWYFYPNAFLREFVGLLADKRFYHAAFIIGTVLIFAQINYLLR